MNMDRIYLDYAATTPVDPQVVQIMTHFLENDYGNPSSLHYFGQTAETALSKARRTILERMNATNAELIFTSGGTESDNLALRGCLGEGKVSKDKKILISPVEHPAIANTASNLEEMYGIKIERLRVDKYGLIEEKEFQK